VRLKTQPVQRPPTHERNLFLDEYADGGEHFCLVIQVLFDCLTGSAMGKVVFNVSGNDERQEMKFLRNVNSSCSQKLNDL
jgi:hypothetical protein